MHEVVCTGNSVASTRCLLRSIQAGEMSLLE